MSKTLKFGIFLLAILCLVLLVITFVDFPLRLQAFGFSAGSEGTPPAETSDADLVAAVESALSSAEGRWQVFTYQVDHIQVQDDGQMAIVWLAPEDPETGDLLGREPELALAQRTPEGQWQVMLEDNEKFTQAFKGFQYAEKSIHGDLISEQEALPKSTRVFGGYYLPWAANLEKRLTWSVGHTSCYPIYYCTHAFDFADGTMFPLVAAKGGTVYHWKDSCSNGDSSCTNSITLEDRSTTPWTYQIYLHIAQNSVPSNLRAVGAPVMQGQYIADVDDTGYSTGHHVHFMVVSEETRYKSVNGYIWGVAEDITFRDVDINWDAATQGGRPRLAYEAETYGGEGRTYYISGNQPANPPIGGLTAPATKTDVTSPVLSVSGWGQDDVRVTKYEILAKYDLNWVTIKQVLGGDTFSTTVDLCQTTIPDGPFQLAVRVWDYEGNPSAISGTRKLIKNVECGAAGSDPDVSLILNRGILALPQHGFVSAAVTRGSTGSNIVSVEFWLHGRDWVRDHWVNLGKDTNGSNGWQAPISTLALPEGNNYTIVAVATDSLGNKGVGVNFNAIVDHTPPWISASPIASPVTTSTVTLRWTGGDTMAGLDYYTLAVNVNGSGYQTLETYLPASTTTYQYPVARNQLVVFALSAYDKSGNVLTRKTGLHTSGYVFPHGVIVPMFYGGY